MPALDRIPDLRTHRNWHNAGLAKVEGHIVKREFLERLSRETQQLKAQGLFKPERVLRSPQSAVVRVGGGRDVINLCANNYLGLANDPDRKSVV